MTAKRVRASRQSKASGDGQSDASRKSNEEHREGSATNAIALILTRYLLGNLSDERGKPIARRDRRRYRAALVAISDYLRKSGCSRLVVNELRELEVGLAELDKGIVRPFLKPAKAANKSDSADIWRARAFVAIAATLLVQLGETRESACMTLARRFPFLKSYIVTKNAKSFAGAIRSWLDRFEQRKIKHEDAQSLFDQRLYLVQRWSGGRQWTSKNALCDNLVRKSMGHACGESGAFLTPEALAALGLD